MNEPGFSFAASHSSLFYPSNDLCSGLAREPMAFLQIRGQGLEQRIDWDSLPIIIGRSANCEARVRDPSISKQHARLSLGEDKKSYLVEDLGSKNGICYQGKILRRLRCRVGEKFKLGNLSFSIEVVEAEGPKTLYLGIALALVICGSLGWWLASGFALFSGGEDSKQESKSAIPEQAKAKSKSTHLPGVSLATSLRLSSRQHRMLTQAWFACFGRYPAYSEIEALAGASLEDVWSFAKQRQEYWLRLAVLAERSSGQSTAVWDLPTAALPLQIPPTQSWIDRIVQRSSGQFQPTDIDSDLKLWQQVSGFDNPKITIDEFLLSAWSVIFGEPPNSEELSLLKQLNLEISLLDAQGLWWKQLYLSFLLYHPRSQVSEQYSTVDFTYGALALATPANVSELTAQENVRRAFLALPLRLPEVKPKLTPEPAVRLELFFDAPILELTRQPEKHSTIWQRLAFSQLQIFPSSQLSLQQTMSYLLGNSRNNTLTICSKIGSAEPLSKRVLLADGYFLPGLRSLAKHLGETVFTTNIAMYSPLKEGVLASNMSEAAKLGAFKLRPGSWEEASYRPLTRALLIARKLLEERSQLCVVQATLQREDFKDPIFWRELSQSLEVLDKYAMEIWVFGNSADQGTAALSLRSKGRSIRGWVVREDLTMQQAHPVLRWRGLQRKESQGK